MRVSHKIWPLHRDLQCSYCALFSRFLITDEVTKMSYHNSGNSKVKTLNLKFKMTIELNNDLSKRNIISWTNSYFQLIPTYYIRKYGGSNFLTTVITKSSRVVRWKSTDDIVLPCSGLKSKPSKKPAWSMQQAKHMVCEYVGLYRRTMDLGNQTRQYLLALSESQGEPVGDRRMTTFTPSTLSTVSARANQ
jgi:hypothetical protein